MFFTSNYEIKEVTETDIPNIVKIYNSNVNFLTHHLGVESINEDWALHEYLEMQKMGFLSCVIIDIQSALPMGFIDYKISEETYLSLIMINSAYKRTGIGGEVLRYFEEYAKSKKSKRIRIDVVSNYDKSILRFWENKGYVSEKEIELSWNGKELPAIKMLKSL